MVIERKWFKINIRINKKKNSSQIATEGYSHAKSFFYPYVFRFIKKKKHGKRGKNKKQQAI